MPRIVNLHVLDMVRLITVLLCEHLAPLFDICILQETSYLQSLGASIKAVLKLSVCILQPVQVLCRRC